MAGNPAPGASDSSEGFRSTQAGLGCRRLFFLRRRFSQLPPRCVERVACPARQRPKCRTRHWHRPHTARSPSSVPWRTGTSQTGLRMELPWHRCLKQGFKKRQLPDDRNGAHRVSSWGDATRCRAACAMDQGGCTAARSGRGATTRRASAAADGLGGPPAAGRPRCPCATAGLPFL
jgi:hypothetical protein